MYVQDVVPDSIAAPETVKTPFMAEVAPGVGQVELMFGFVSKTSPDGSVSTKPRPLFAIESDFETVKISDAGCPGDTDVGSNFLVKTGVEA